MNKIILISKNEDLVSSSQDLIQKLNESVVGRLSTEDLYFFNKMFDGHGITNLIELDSKNLVQYVSNKEPKSSLYEYIKDGNKHLYKNSEVTHFSKFDENKSDYENIQNFKKEIETIVFIHLYSHGYNVDYVVDNFEIKIVSELTIENYKQDALTILRKWRGIDYDYKKDVQILDSVEKVIANDVCPRNLYMELICELGFEKWKICFPKNMQKVEKIVLESYDIEFNINDALYYDFDTKDMWAFRNRIEYYKDNSDFKKLTKEEQDNFEKYEYETPYHGVGITINKKDFIPEIPTDELKEWIIGTYENKKVYISYISSDYPDLILVENVVEKSNTPENIAYHLSIEKLYNSTRFDVDLTDSEKLDYKKYKLIDKDLVTYMIKKTDFLPNLLSSEIKPNIIGKYLDKYCRINFVSKEFPEYIMVQDVIEK